MPTLVTFVKYITIAAIDPITLDAIVISPLGSQNRGIDKNGGRFSIQILLPRIGTDPSSLLAIRHINYKAKFVFYLFKIASFVVIK